MENFEFGSGKMEVIDIQIGSEHDNLTDGAIPANGDINCCAEDVTSTNPTAGCNASRPQECMRIRIAHEFVDKTKTITLGEVKVSENNK